MRKRINDEDRRLWVLNDEGLYQMFITRPLPRQNIRTWISCNRRVIDEVIGNVTSNRQPAHYLVYGKSGKPTKELEDG